MSGENSGSTGVLGGFKDFLLRGNVVELAVAVVVGTAFSKIVDAVVKGFVNPLVGAIGTKNLDEYRSCLRGPCKTDPATGEVLSGVPISWGTVLSASLTFLITAAVVYFLMILPMNQYKRRQADRHPVVETETGLTEVELLTEIRDALVAQRTGSAEDTGAGPSGAALLAAPRSAGADAEAGAEKSGGRPDGSSGGASSRA